MMRDSDSDTYLAILEEGAVKQAREIIRDQGGIKFGPADKLGLDCLTAITELARLDRILHRLLEATSWQDLLDTP